MASIANGNVGTPNEKGVLEPLHAMFQMIWQDYDMSLMRRSCMTMNEWPPSEWVE